MNENEKVIMNLKYMEDYLKTTNKLSEEFCDNQSKINRLYNKLTDDWCDAVSRKTGDRLRQANRLVNGLLNEFFDTFKKLNEKSRQLREEYTRTGTWDVIFNEPQIDTRIKETDGMDSEFIKGTTVKGIKDFEKALSDYIETTNKRLKLVNYAYEEVGKGWRDSQYSATGKKISEFSTDLKKELTALEELLKEITKRRIAFEKALGIRV